MKLKDNVTYCRIYSSVTESCGNFCYKILSPARVKLIWEWSFASAVGGEWTIFTPPRDFLYKNRDVSFRIQKFIFNLAFSMFANATILQVGSIRPRSFCFVSVMRSEWTIVYSPGKDSSGENESSNCRGESVSVPMQQVKRNQIRSTCWQAEQEKNPCPD